MAIAVALVLGVILCVTLVALLPKAQPATDLLVLGIQQASSSASPHVISSATLVRHIAIFGATGSGKSVCGTNLAAQIIRLSGRYRAGMLIVDLKDSLATDIARIIPEERLSDTLLFDPADRACPPAFNPFADVPEALRTLAASEIVTAFKQLFAENWGVRLEHVLRMACLTLLETPDATLLDVPRILTDEPYRAWATRHVTNFSVKLFWEREFPGIVGKNLSTSNVGSILNKLSIFAYPEIRNVVGQTRRGLDLRAAMDSNRILLCNLPQGALGSDASAFLAALLIAKVTLAAQSRVDLGHADRKPFIVFADEMQNYQTTAFEKAITEGRSMGLGIITACQFPEQLSKDMRLVLSKNVAHQLTCQRLVDQRGQERHIVTVVPLQDPNAQLLTRTLWALPPYPNTTGDVLARIRVQSRRTLGRPRREVEREIARRLGAADPTPDDLSPRTPQEKARHDDHFFEPEDAQTPA